VAPQRYKVFVLLKDKGFYFLQKAYIYALNHGTKARPEFIPSHWVLRLNKNLLKKG